MVIQQTSPTGTLKRWLGLSDRSVQEHDLIEALHLHAGLVIQSAARVLGSMSDAEDVAQDIAEKLLKKPPHNVRSWPAFLKTTAIRAAIDRLRAQRPTDALDQIEDALPVHPSAQDAAVEHEKAAMVRSALKAMNERDADLFSLYYLGDLKQAEVATQLNMTPSAVGVALHRLREKLTNEIAKVSGQTSGENQ